MGKISSGDVHEKGLAIFGMRIKEWEKSRQSPWKIQNIGMEDYLGRKLIGEMESSKIIHEVNLFPNRPLYSASQYNPNVAPF